MERVELAGFPSPLEWDAAPVAARLGQAFAFHASTDGERRQLVRYFALEQGVDPRVGFLAQSPLGGGCSVRFAEIAFRPGRLGDIRSGA